jgi:D-psicose/D-tagatose/L-ribulose 3-epimerase
MIGINYAYWAMDWDVDFVPLLSKAKELGYDQLEINGNTFAIMSSWGRQRLANEAKENQIALSFDLALFPQFDLSSLDERVRKSGIAYLTQLIKAVGSLGGGNIGGAIQSCWPARLPKGEDKRWYFDASVESMISLMPIAEDNNVRLNVEAINRYEHFLLNTCSEGLEYVHAVNHPNCGLLLNTFHMNIEEDNLGNAIRMAGFNLQGFHIGETNRKPVGLGRQPWGEIKKALDDIFYEGALVQESFITPRGQVGDDLSIWREVIPEPDLDALAGESALFMRERLG